MNKRIVRFNALMLVLALVMTSLIGCGSKEKPSGDSSGGDVSAGETQESQLGSETAGEDAVELRWETL